MSTSLRQIQALLEFTSADLEANRRGRLSKAQIERLELTATREMQALLVIPAVVVLWIAVAFDFTLAFPVIAVLVLIIIGFVGLHKDYLKGLKSRHVRKVSGQVSKKLSGDFGIIQYVIHVGDERLPISQPLYDQLSEGKFDIYMLGGDILSLEPQRRTTAPASKAKPAAKPQAKTATVSRAKPATAKKPTTKTAAKSTTTQRSTSKASTTASKSSTKRQAPAVKQAKPTGKAQSREMPLTRTRSTASTTKTTKPSPNR